MEPAEQQRKTHAVPPQKELRIIALENCTVRVVAGDAEWDGFQLAAGNAYPIPQGQWLALYALEPCDVEVVGSAHVYVGASSVTPQYGALHEKLNAKRNEAKQLPEEPGPVILVTGPPHAGKATFALHMLNYAVRDGFTPLFVDMSLASNLITVPGCVACTAVTSPFSPSTQLDFNFQQPLVFCVGTTRQAEKAALCTHFARQLAEYAARKTAANQAVFHSGTVIRLPFTTMDALREVVQAFKVDIVFVLDSEHLFNDIQTTDLGKPITPILVPKPAGIPLCTDPASFLKRAEHRAVKPQFRPSRQQLAAAQARIDPEAEAGDVLRKDRRGGCPGNAPAEDQHEEQVQPDVQQGGNAEEPERRDGIARRAQQTGKEIIERRGDQAREDDDEIFAHLAVQLRRNLQKAEDGVKKRIDRGVQHERHGDDQAERMGHRAAEPRLVLLPQRNGKQRARAHREAEEDRRQKRHQRIGRADGGKRVFAEGLSDDQRIGDVIELLQQIARDHRQGKAQQPFCDAALGQVLIHGALLVV